MKKFTKRICLVIAIIIVFTITIKVIDYNSLASKNTRYLEQVLSEDIKFAKDNSNGNVKDLITLDYDKIYISEPYKPIEDIEKQIGFKYSKLQQGLSKGFINNILFVKDNSAVAYLFGSYNNTGYYINIPKGEYTKSQVDKMTYIIQENEFDDYDGNTKTYMYYEFRD